MKKFFLHLNLSILLLFSSNLFSQDFIKNPCGFQDVLYNLSKEDNFNANQNLLDWKQNQINTTNQRITNSIEDTTYTVQVVVHVVYLGNNKYENIPDNIIRSQIDALNRDFNLLNADTVNTRDYFKQFRGNAKIKFELATVAPNGSPTNGITRTQGNLGNLPGWIITDLLDVNPLLAATLTLLKFEPLKSDFNLLTGGSIGKPSWNTNKYLNIWVCDMNYSKRLCNNCLNLKPGGALLGLAYPPPNIPHWITTVIFGTDTIRQDGSLDRGAQNDGIVIDFRAFGQNNWYAQDSASLRFKNFYSMGRTPVHEVGHYFGLRHTWGDSISTTIGGITVSAPPGCDLDDFIDDTPNERTAFANNITDLNNPCDSAINTCDVPYLGTDYPDMLENYMDYSTDLCYNMFTKQQVDFMKFILTTKRPNIITSRELVPTVVTAIKNIKLKEFGVSFFPNPAKNNISVQVETIIKSNVSINIIDITGKIVSSQFIPKGFNNHTVDVANLASGIYAIQFSNNEFSAVDKFVKE